MSDSARSYILAIDQGTTGSTALLCDNEGKVVSTGYHEIRQIYPQPGYVEHDPEEFIQNSLAVAREAIQKAGISLHQVKGIGITNQRETTSSGIATPASLSIMPSYGNAAVLPPCVKN